VGGARAWARSEWRRRWRELAALAVLLGLIGAAALTCLAGARRSATSYQRLRRAGAARDVGLQAGSSGRPLLERVLGLPGVQSGAILSGYPAFTNVKSDFDLGILAPVDGRYGRVIERPLVLEGRPPKPDRAQEVALNPRARDQLHARVGQVITVSTLTPAQIAVIEQEFSGKAEGPRLRLHVTGIIRSPDDFTGDVATATLYATPAFETAYGDRVGRYGTLAGVRLRQGSGGVAAFEDQVHRLAGDQGIDVTRAAQVGKEITQSVRVLGGALGPGQTPCARR